MSLKKSPSRSSLGPTDKVEETDQPPRSGANESCVSQGRMRSLVESEKAEAEGPGFTLVVPPKLIATTLDRNKSTLGSLFTDGGLEDFLIRILEHIERRHMVKCLMVCKNTNAVMVKSLTIQIHLRSHLFGYGCLPIPSRYFPRQSDYPDPAGSPFNSTAKVSVEAMIYIHRCFENSLYTDIRPTPIPLGTCKPEDMQAGTILLTHEAGWTVIADMVTGQLVRRNSPLSTIALCAEDKVVVEAEGHIMSIGDDNTRRHKVIRANFASLAGNPDGSSAKHPDAKVQRVTLHIAEKVHTGTDNEPIKIRLYPGGLAAVLLAGGHDCGAKCRDSTLPPELVTRLVIFNWHSNTGLGVLKLPDTTIKILDFQFLNDQQIICGSIHSIDGNTYPCIDVYDVPQKHVPSDELGLISTHLLPEVFLMGSVRFPRLAASRSGCMWAQAMPHIAHFDLRVSNPSKLTAALDQVVTFQLDGQVGRKSEKLQGVVLLSRLRQIMLDATDPSNTASTRDACKTTGLDDSKTTPSSSNPTQSTPPIEWEKWSSAVGFSHTKSSSLLEPRCTQVANLARSRKDKTHAVLMIRDYNQRIISAPPGYMNRNLGHPTDNEFQDQIEDEAQVPTEDNFKLVTEVKSIKSILFGRVVEYGLSHRLRMVDLGVFARNTATSRVCGNTTFMSIFAELPSNQYEWYLFGFVFEPNHEIAKLIASA